jgi:tetratricopeptide (TPR) repeat protein
MKSLILFLAGALLAGCSSMPVAFQAPPPNLLNDQLFKPPTEVVDTSKLFEVSPAMRTYLDNNFRGSTYLSNTHLKNGQRRLFDALYAKGQLKLEYDSAKTRPASETFEAGSGNCMSLVIMTAAFAKELGMPVVFQNVMAGETWSRNGAVYFSSSHVNIALGTRRIDMPQSSSDSADYLTIDFLPPEDLRGHRTERLEEEAILAMYLNNRAAEALARNELDNAYAWAREGITRFPAYAPTVNTLGVIYIRKGQLAEAETAMRYALLRDPKNAIIMTNFVPLLRLLGKGTEADTMAMIAASINPHPAFEYFDQGMAAMDKGDFRTAREMFEREVKRAPYYHEFHYWLAMAEFRLGDNPAAREQLALAAQSSTTRKDRDRYSAKLEHLRMRQ